MRKVSPQRVSHMENIEYKGHKFIAIEVLKNTRIHPCRGCFFADKKTLSESEDSEECKKISAKFRCDADDGSLFIFRKLSFTV